MDSLEEEDDKHFIIRHRIKLIVVAMLLAGAGAFFMAGRETRPMRKAAPVERIVAITPPRPPPAPRPPEPPTRPEQAPRADEMIVQEPVTAEDQAPPEVSPAEPDHAPSEGPSGPAGEAMGTNIQGDGPANAFGLSGRGGGGLIGGGGGGGGRGGGGSRWGWYAGQVQSRIERALQDNDKTRVAGLDINVRLWADAAGRITHVQLVGTTGDADMDRTLKRDVLSGLVMREPPPADMPQPIVIRILGLRPD